MNQTDVLLKIIELAKEGAVMSPPDAISHISALIDRLDMLHEDYERDVESLMKIGALIWTLDHLRK
jgi:hypothetical protein